MVAGSSGRRSKKAGLRRVAIREYALLRFHARNCTDCRPGQPEAAPPVINRICRVGMAGMAEYKRAYAAWLECSEEG